MHLLNKKLGFTLIELLVVVSIIGVLSSLIYINFSEARDSSRNRVWQTELKEVQLALELYKSQNGVYPPAQIADPFTTLPNNCFNTVVGGAIIAGSKDERISGVPCPSNLPIIENQTGGPSSVEINTKGFNSDYIDELPDHDSSGNSNCELVYTVDSDNENRSWYKLSAINCLSGVDSESGVQPDDEFALCPSTCSTCSSDQMNNSYIESATFYESMAVYSAGGRCQ